METYKILGGLHRHGLGGDQEVELIMNEGAGAEGEREDDDEDEKDTSEKKKKKRVLKFSDCQGEKTLDKLENINLQSLESEAMVDPLFRQTTQMFDEISLGSLMTSKLNINNTLILMLDSSTPNINSEDMKWVSSGLGQIGDLPLDDII
jgi:hypothetical protein